MTERFIRDVLLKRKWSEEDLDELSIVYISRGAPGDRSVFKGSDIVHIGKSFIEFSDGNLIPYHRMLEIYKKEELIWSRKTTR